jgi:hypothetical protein
MLSFSYEINKYNHTYLSPTVKTSMLIFEKEEIDNMDRLELPEN